MKLVNSEPGDGLIDYQDVVGNSFLLAVEYCLMFKYMFNNNSIFSRRFGSLLGLVKDPVLGTMWAYTERAVFKYKVSSVL